VCLIDPAGIPLHEHSFLTGFVRLVFSFSLKFGIKKRLDLWKREDSSTVSSKNSLLYLHYSTFCMYEAQAAFSSPTHTYMQRASEPSRAIEINSAARTVLLFYAALKRHCKKRHYVRLVGV
jgi:hypothetical protein